MSRSRGKTNPPAKLSPSKRRAFIVFTMAFPFLFVILLELVLSLLNAGTDLSLVTTEKWYGKEYYVLNGNVKGRYFPTFQFRPSISPDFFPVVKEPGTYRIFCLGGSTTVGYPYWYNGAFSSFLRDRLHALFPERRIEVINMGMTATNSFTVLDMARDLIRLQPDLFVVYDGHNEFYGALGVASRESIGRMRWITEAYLKLVRFRTFCQLKDLYGMVRRETSGEESGEGTGTLMERLARGQYIPYGSPTYQRGLDVFRDNLKALTELCLEHKVPLIISSQVSNLRDQPPFVSYFPDEMSQEVRTRFDGLMRQGMAELRTNEFEQALSRFRSAAELDSLHAEAHYRIAQCLDRLNRMPEARMEYLRARDYDELRFRTSTDFNTAILKAASDPEVIFADIEHVFDINSPDSLTGSTLMFEHLHPKSRGYFLMAREYARLMRENGFLAGTEEWRRRDTLDEAQLWKDRSVTELDERVALRRTEVLTSGWPFQSQIPIVDAVPPNDTLGQITEQVTKSKWTWVEAHEAAANYYLLRRDLEGATREYRVIIDQLPMVDVQLYIKLAKLLLDQNKTKELREVLLASLNLQPTMLAYRALGDIALQSGSPQEGVTYYEKLLAFPQSRAEQVENGYMLSLAYARSGSKQQAVDQLLKVLKIQPDNRQAVDLLAQLSMQR